MLRRIIVYAVIVAVAVGGSLYFLSNQPLGNRNFVGPPSPVVPKAPWEASENHTAAANADFRVETELVENVSWGGTPVGTDWPQFNGVRRDNRSDETGLLAEWPPEGPPLAWAAHGAGAGFSSVAVVQGVVYTMGNKGESEAIMALDAGTGEKIWSTPFTWASHPSNGEGPRCTPAVHAGRVVGLGAAGELVCVNALNGSIQWQKNIAQEYGGSVPGWGYCESVLIDRDLSYVIATPGGDKATLVAFDLASGKELWKCLLDGKDRPGYASPTFADLGGIRHYIQFTSGGTVGVRADNGKFLWRDDSASSGMANCSSPLVADDFVFSASGYGKGGSLVRLDKSGESIRSQFVYHTDNMRSHHGDMVIDNGLIFGSDDPGVLTCLDLKTGEVKWKNRSVGKGAVTYADGHIYLRSEQGPVALVKAAGESYVESGRFDQPHRSNMSAWSHPVVAAGRLFLRDQDALLCYQLKD